MISTTTTSAKKVSEAGQRIYEQLRTKIEPRHFGKIVAIDPTSGKYFVGETLHDAIEKGRKKYPDKVFYVVKVGSRAVYSFTSGATVGTTTTL